MIKINANNKSIETTIYNIDSKLEFLYHQTNKLTSLINQKVKLVGSEALQKWINYPIHYTNLLEAFKKQLKNILTETGNNQTLIKKLDNNIEGMSFSFYI